MKKERNTDVGNIDWLPVVRTRITTEPATQACALTRNQTSDLSVYRMMLNQLSHTGQGRAHSFFHSIIAFNKFLSIQ